MPVFLTTVYQYIKNFVGIAVGVNNHYWILGEKSISVCIPSSMSVEKVISNSDVTAIAVVRDKLFVGVKL